LSAIRVLIIAGSAGIRGVLAEIVAQDPGLEVMGTAADPFAGARRIEDEIPDVIILDADTPRMDGLTFLRKLMAQYPLPVVIISSVIDAASPAATEILEAGAMDVIGLPKAGARAHILASADAIRKKLRSAVQRRLRSPADLPSQTVSPKLTADAILPPPHRRAKVSPTEPVVCIGASTGGTESLRVVLETLPRDCPGIVIVQHMPERFTATFARRLDALCQISVKEAAHNDLVLPGHALIAPGNQHMLLSRRGHGYVVELKDGPLVSRSAARSAGRNAVGVIMTGMGDDGARGLLEMHQAGSVTIAEHESTAVVFGMPKEAIARGGADIIVPLPGIAGQILTITSKSRR
jgi:two-component system, chemotaxis family, protein-glutamate methylesterase/glutaminase